MKKSIYLLPIILVGITLSFVISCKDDPLETCDQDEICDAKEVVACCEGDVCVWKYDGKEYAEEDVDQLAIDLGCGVGLAMKSTDDESDVSDVVYKLRSLMKGVRAKN